MPSLQLPANSNFTLLSSNVQTPVNGGQYTIQSLAFSHMFNLAFSGTTDGSVIQGFPSTNPVPSNMIVRAYWLISFIDSKNLALYNISDPVFDVSNNGWFSCGYTADNVHSRPVAFSVQWPRWLHSH